jgi:prepilin peptidase CpaA
MALLQSEAWLYLPFLLPLCFYVAFTDLSQMRITNQAVLAMGGLFLVLGLIALPFDVFLWRLAQLGFMLVLGLVLNAGGAMGAGDAKFLAAAAPYVALGDLRLLIVIFTANLLAAVATHRIAKYTPLRALAPDWISWDKGWKFPMGLSLAGTLAIYLIGGAIYGAS